MYVRLLDCFSVLPEMMNKDEYIKKLVAHSPGRLEWQSSVNSKAGRSDFHLRDRVLPIIPSDAIKMTRSIATVQVGDSATAPIVTFTLGRCTVPPSAIVLA